MRIPDSDHLEAATDSAPDPTSEPREASTEDRAEDRTAGSPAGPTTDATADATAGPTDEADPSSLPVDEPRRETRSGFVAIVGKPNVGKSTLLNTLLGVKVAPITPKPQTTRRGVRGIFTEDDRQVVFVDTPGLQSGRSALDGFMRREIRDAVADVDLVLWVVDLRRPPGGEDKEVARLLRGLPEATRVYIVGNKLDVAKYPQEALELYKDLYPRAERVLALSALDDPKAVYALRGDLLDELTPAPFFYPADIRSDQSRAQWTAEIIRESAMIHLRQELPYSVAVLVTDWTEPEGKRDPPIVIEAEIWVERANHRRIVIGAGGKMIREIGRTARKQLEVFLDHHVYLELEVVVRADWREDAAALRELGYQD